VRIDEERIRSYLLSRRRPVGRFKARVFAARGFDEGSAQAFVLELRRIAATGEVAAVEDMEFGREVHWPGDLNGPVGSAQVSTIWIQETGASEVRLVTVPPRCP
jgi:hypothetical protein